MQNIFTLNDTCIADKNNNIRFKGSFCFTFKSAIILYLSNITL